AIIEEALSAGIEEVALIVQASDRGIFEDFFHTRLRIENFNKLSKANQQYCDYLSEVGHRVSFVVQDTQEGFGHAIYCAREWVGNEPFLLLLGDHLSISENGTSCAGQLVEAYNRYNQSMVGVKVSHASEIGNFGCVTGVWDETDFLLNVSEIVEKPEIEYAREHLQVEGMEKDTYLTLFGQYILRPQIFDCLEEKISRNIRERGEFQLTSSIDRLRQEDGLKACLIRGRAFDIGQPEAYLNSIMEYGKRKG
ncbi:MAG: sugar phosphate nucleotidyltransferase, partial [Candidatus Latescibacterota bacterium]